MNVVDEFHVNPVRHLWENRRFLRNLVMATEPGSHRLAHWRTSGVDHGDRSPSGRFADTHAQRRCQIVQRRCAGLLMPRVLNIWLHEFILILWQINVTAYGIASATIPMTDGYD